MRLRPMPVMMRPNTGHGFLFCCSSVAQNMRVRSPTVLAVKKYRCHELLDAALAPLVFKTQALGHFDLHVEGQPLFRAPRQKMQMAAHEPEKLFRLGERLEIRPP